MSGTVQAEVAEDPSPEPAAPTTKALRSYEPGLDGLRAVGMCFMLAYHAEFSWAKGAFFALSQFFTLSGFLITSILLRQHAGGGIRLGPFWTRRYRRLIPASLLTLAGVLLFGATVANELQVAALPGQVSAALAQVVNWYFVVTETSYIDQFAAPSPVQHFWSLAVEEQFYLVMPVLVFVVLRRTGSLKVIGAVFALGAAISTIWMAHLYSSGSSLDRLYYGTDTRAAEMLVGALLAVVLHRFPLRPGTWGRRVLGAAGIVAFGVSAWCLTSVSLTDGPVWTGGFMVFALVTAVLIVSILGHSGPVSALYSVGLLAAMGRITYGLYLFHWPIFLWLDEERTGLAQWPLFGVRLAVTFALAVLSYRYFEMPIRDGFNLGIDGVARWAIIPLASLALIAGALVISTREVESTDPLLAVSTEMPELDAGAADGVLDVLVVADDSGVDVAAEMVAVAATSSTVEVAVAEPFSCGQVEDVGSGPVCSAWLEEWPRLVARLDPDAVLFLVTDWAPGSLAGLAGEAVPSEELAGWTADLLGNGLDLLAADGAPVVWAVMPTDFGTALRRQAEPFNLAMTGLATTRGDLRRVIGTELATDAVTGASLEPGEAAEVLLADLELYRRRGAGASTRVLVVGDSVALTLGYGLERWAAEDDEYVVWTGATEGCGFADEGMVLDLLSRESEVSERCRGVASSLPAQVAEFDPDIVVVLTSAWDLQERRLPEWDDVRGPGDAAFDAYLLREYGQAADVLASGGARIVWVQPPCAGQARDTTVIEAGLTATERVRHLNEVILPELVASREDVGLFDLFGVLCPEGEFVESLGGVDDLRPDGVHFSKDGSIWLAETYAESLLASAPL
jgi:peptidoglycan/LPS O-acetylase OafA/YrhL/lysophospholipase L1-like esterase